MAKNVLVKWTDDVYDYDFQVHRCPLVGFQKKYQFADGKALTMDGSVGVTFEVEGENGRTVIMWFDPSISPSSTDGMSAIAHEAFHAACRVFNKTGVVLSEASEEAYAYYLSFITAKVVEALS